MANTYVTTGSSSLGGTAGGAGLVQKAYDRLLEFALRSEPLIRSVADKRPRTTCSCVGASGPPPRTYHPEVTWHSNAGFLRQHRTTA